MTDKPPTLLGHGAVALIIQILACSLLYMFGLLPFQLSLEYNFKLFYFGSDETAGVILGESPTSGGAVVYEYSVDGKTYEGTSSIPYDSNGTIEMHKEKEKIGNKFTVYYCISEPEISLLGEPEMPAVSLFLFSLLSIFFYGYLVFEVVPKMSEIVKNKKNESA